MRYDDRALVARDRLLSLALLVVQRDYSTEEGPHVDDDADYLSDQLALAAREFVAHIAGLPASDRPVGWEAPVVL